jgi:hypothetical protein
VLERTDARAVDEDSIVARDNPDAVYTRANLSSEAGCGIREAD